MSEDKLDSRLERLLSEAEPYLDDAGFASAVMGRLPPPRAGLAKSLRRRIMVFGVAGAAASAAAWASAGAMLEDIIPNVGSSLAGIAPLSGALLAVTASLLVALYPVAESIGRALALREMR